LRATIHRIAHGNGLRRYVASDLPAIEDSFAKRARLSRLVAPRRTLCGVARTTSRAVAPLRWHACRNDRISMAAVFALVFLFVLASAGLLVKVIINDPTFATMFALMTFLTLAWGVFLGLFKMAKGWENEAGLH
jgi:hypothetical protein